MRESGTNLIAPTSNAETIFTNEDATINRVCLSYNYIAIYASIIISI